MRNFELLDTVKLDDSSGLITFTIQAQTTGQPVVAMRREGGYIALSASYGPFEIALRPRFQELSRTLSRLQPVEGLQTTRQVGTAQAYLSVGLKSDGVLLLRPTIVADATGHIAFNLALTDSARKALFDWLPVEPES
ncbi:MAG: hypothetical protein J0L63_05870 [Anaerolineae bacterium]|nr:hypothetical protein [Anaerolineae bacterium]MBN8618411.1 hypothetical protein [Anaerolineae bacterium]